MNLMERLILEFTKIHSLKLNFSLNDEVNLLEQRIEQIITQIHCFNEQINEKDKEKQQKKEQIQQYKSLIQEGKNKISNNFQKQQDQFFCQRSNFELRTLIQEETDLVNKLPQTRVRALLSEDNIYQDKKTTLTVMYDLTTQIENYFYELEPLIKNLANKTKVIKVVIIPLLIIKTIGLPKSKKQYVNMKMENLQVFTDSQFDSIYLKNYNPQVRVYEYKEANMFNGFHVFDQVIKEIKEKPNQNHIVVYITTGNTQGDSVQQRAFLRKILNPFDNMIVFYLYKHYDKNRINEVKELCRLTNNGNLNYETAGGQTCDYVYDLNIKQDKIKNQLRTCFRNIETFQSQIFKQKQEMQRPELDKRAQERLKKLQKLQQQIEDDKKDIRLFSRDKQDFIKEGEQQTFNSMKDKSIEENISVYLQAIDEQEKKIRQIEDDKENILKTINELMQEQEILMNEEQLQRSQQQPNRFKFDYFVNENDIVSLNDAMKALRILKQHGSQQKYKYNQVQKKLEQVKKSFINQEEIEFHQRIEELHLMVQ